MKRFFLVFCMALIVVVVPAQGRSKDSGSNLRLKSSSAAASELIHYMAVNAHRLPTDAEFEAARDVIYKAEIQVILDGHPELVDPEDFKVCRAMIASSGTGNTKKEVTLTQRLPSKGEALEKIRREKSALGGASVEDSYNAVIAAQAAEVNAIRSGHPELVALEDLAGAKEVAKQEDRQDRLDLHHCPSVVRIGIEEACVYILLGYPDHTNDDALSGKQLVYPHDYFVYVDHDGIVENIQSTY